VNLKTTEHVMAALAADYAIQEARRKARYTEYVMSHLKLITTADRRKTPAPDGVDIRQLHRQHCQPERFTDWSGLLIAVFVVGVIAVIAIGSTIDFRGL
jgi:hypothetical protein